MRSHGCGAARDYLSVDASGSYSACNRFVNDPLGRMGDLVSGIDDRARADFLTEHQVEAQDTRTAFSRHRPRRTGRSATCATTGGGDE
ncbi:MAG: hypothetical protein EBT13_09090 [Rhodobacteraceae bacterium]|nr:hypothetical protein [Paracoccaceae bacterium]